MKKALLLLILLPTALAGCGTYGEYRSQFIRSKGWVGPLEQTPDNPLYCYRTIGGADCYEQPLPGQERRLINKYEPKTCDPAPHTHDGGPYEHPHYENPYIESGPMRISQL